MADFELLPIEMAPGDVIIARVAARTEYHSERSELNPPDEVEYPP